MIRPLLACTLLAATAPAQLAAGNALVATRLPGAPATALLAVDLQNGASAPLGAFPGDHLAPLAVAIDPVDFDVLLCLDAGGGQSVVLRLPRGHFAGAWSMGVVPGTVRHLTLDHDELLLTVGGPQGGLWAIPRTGGTAALRWARPFLSAVQSFGGSWGVAAWSGDQGPPASPPGVGYVDFTTGQFSLGPETWPGFAHPGITGVLDLPTALPRQILSHSDGTVSLHTMLMMSVPVTLPIQPPVPAGGAVALKPQSPYSTSPILLGGAAFPHLWSFDAWAATPTRTLLSLALPGDPVDFAVAPDFQRADLLPFGRPCGNQSLNVQVFSLPTLGNGAFAVQLGGGAPQAPTLFAVGLSDTLGGVLPWPLPGGCPLRTSADAVVFHLSNPMGQAVQPMPIPAQPALAGLLLFAQWLQAPGGAFTSSAGQAIHVGN